MFCFQSGLQRHLLWTVECLCKNSSLSRLSWEMLQGWNRRLLWLLWKNPLAQGEMHDVRNLLAKQALTYFFLGHYSRAGRLLVTSTSLIASSTSPGLIMPWALDLTKAKTKIGQRNIIPSMASATHSPIWQPSTRPCSQMIQSLPVILIQS